MRSLSPTRSPAPRPRTTTSRRHRRGVLLVQLMLLFTLLVGLVSLSVDYGKVRSAKNDLQGAIEAASLAGAAGLEISPAEARLRARTIASNNTVNGAPFALLDSDIELGRWDTTTRTFTLLTGNNESQANAMRITGRLQAARGTQVRTSFLPIIGGQSSFDLASAAVACRAVKSEDVVVVQDVSQSFYDEVGYARSGDLDLLGGLNTTGGTCSYGLVAFTGSAKTIASIKKVTSNYSSLQTAVNSLNVGGSNMPPTYSNTDIAAGIEQAQTLFDAYTSTSPSRSMVIVSDGEPSPSWYGKHPGMSSSELLAQARADADYAWSKGINVFVVFWNQSNDPTAAANLKSLIRGKGVFVNVTDPTKISEAISGVFATTTIVK